MALVYLVAFWAIVSGFFLIAMGFRPSGRREWLLALGGVISVIFGVLLVFAPIPPRRHARPVVRRLCARVRHRVADRRIPLAPTT